MFVKYVAGSFTGELEAGCLICFDEFASEEEIFTHPSSGTPHAYHLRCISEWVERLAICPQCKIPVTHVNGRKVDSALIRAANRENLREILTILNQGDYQEVDRSAAVQTAIQRNKIDIFQVLLSKGPLTVYGRGVAVREASVLGRYEMLELLLANGPISADVRGEVVVLMAQEYRFDNRLDILRLLLKEHIDIFYRGRAVVGAADISDFDGVQLLLTNATITVLERGSAVRKAASSGHLPITRLLLANGGISASDRRLAYTHALSTGHKDLADLIYIYGPGPVATLI